MKSKRTRGKLALVVSLLCASIGCTHRIDRAHRSRQAFEHGLLPAVILDGRPLPSWSIRERMARYRVPSVSIAIVDDGRIEWAQGYGVTRAGGTDAVMPATLFQAASLSKVVTAVGALLLVQEGRLALDEDVNRRLVHWKVLTNAFTSQVSVTLRRLLSHTAGATVSGFRGYVDPEPLPDLQQMLDGEPPANSYAVRIDSMPGRNVRYSGGGYLIIQQLVEDATGQPFGEWMQKHVLDPAGMSSSTFRQPDSGARDSSVACGHGFDGTPVRNCANRYPELAPAGLWSTPTDLARLGIALSASLRGEPHALLDRATAELMLTRVLGDMGLGPGVHGQGDGLHFDHAGWNHGFRAYMVIYPRLGKGLVVMANGDGAEELIEEIVRSAARTYQWPDFAPQHRMVVSLDSARLDRHAGEYEVADIGLVLTVRRENDHLVVAAPRGSSYTFHPQSDDTYFAIEDGAELTFADSSDHATSTMLIWGMTATRRSGARTLE